jgi:UDP-glucose 4-epimerase
VDCGQVRSAAVVGADGFIGRHLTQALRARGVRVSTFTRAREPCWPDDPAAPSIVFYLASSITPAVAEQHPELVAEDHRGLAELLCRLAHSPRPPTVVLTSSAGTVYDPQLPGPCAEDAPTRATSRYGEAKLALERLLLSHADAIPSVILRLTNVYGPRQRVGRSQGVLAYWLAAVLAGQPLQVIGDPDTTRDYVYVDDVVDCMLRVAARSPELTADGPVTLNVGAGVRTTLAELLGIVERVVDRPLVVEHLPGRTVDRRDTYIDVRRAYQVLGWRCRTALADGVMAMWRTALADHQPASTLAGAGAGSLVA